MKYYRIFSLILLVISAACGKNLEKQIDHQIRTLDHMELDSEQVEILSVEESGDFAIAEVSIKTAIKMRRENGSWLLDEVRLGDRKWEKISRILEALNLRREDDTAEKMAAIQSGLNRYREIRGNYPVVHDFRELVDILAPQYLNPVIRLDAWWNSFSYRSDDGKHYELRSAGPDRELDTEDDLVRSG